MRGSRLALATVVAVAVAMLPVDATSAGVRRWTGNGPPGGVVGDIAVHPQRPDVVLSGSVGAGVFRSTDAGRQWQRSSNGLPPDTLVFDLEYAQSSPSVVYATTYADGVFKSTDGGRTWGRAGMQQFGTVVSVGVHPADASIVFIGTGSELYRSDDAGGSWREVTRGDGRSVWAGIVEFAPSNPNVVYAAGSELLVSTDGGVTWAETGAPPHIDSMIVHPFSSDVLYIGNGDGFSKSVDGAKTFTLVVALPVLDHGISLAFDPANLQTVYAGAYYSGVYRLSSGGETVQAWDRGLPTQRVTALQPVRGGDVILAGVAHHSVYRRGRGAEQWSASRAGFRASGIRALAVAPSAGSVVYAGTYQQGVARSTDGGASWSWRGLHGRIVDGLAVHPNAPRVVFAASDRGIYRSRDGGASWRRVLHVPYEGATDVVIAASSPRVVYASFFEGGVWRSGDGGATWRESSLERSQVVQSLAVHPTRPNTVYAGTRFSTVVKSTDGGRVWRAGQGLPIHFDPLDIAIDPSRPRRVFTVIEADRGGGVFRSGDGGATWRRMAGGTEPESGSSIVIDPRRPWRVFAGAYGSTRPGVFRSTDHGRTWIRMNDGLTTRWIGELALRPDGRTLHAGTTAYGLDAGGGVFSYRFD